MRTELERCERMLSDQLRDIDDGNGNVRFFAAAYLAQAIRFYSELEGVASLASAITRLGQKEIDAYRSRAN